LGKLGDIDMECRAILYTHEIYQNDFSEECEKELKAYQENLNEKLEYKITEEEISKRLDLRNKNIFTIDPVTAKDLDDALSIE